MKVFQARTHKGGCGGVPKRHVEQADCGGRSLENFQPTAVVSYPKLRLQDLGLTDYRTTQILQKKLVENGEETLLITEHHSVYTAGRKIKPPLPNFVLPCERGGEITYHNPGQIIFYPILKLVGKERNVLGYIRKLENVFILSLQSFGLELEHRDQATGVWVKGKNKKIASLGVAISRWTTYHGIALNFCNDLSGFQKISPCGFHPEVMTSVALELKNPPSRAELLNSLLQSFSLIFADRPVIPNRFDGTSGHRLFAAENF